MSRGDFVYDAKPFGREMLHDERLPDAERGSGRRLAEQYTESLYTDDAPTDSRTICASAVIGQGKRETVIPRLSGSRGVWRRLLNLPVTEKGIRLYTGF